MPDAFANAQSELQRRVKKIHEEHDIVAYHLKKWVEKADAIASRVSNIGRFGYFVRPLLDGLTTLDQIYMLLYRAGVLLTVEEYFNSLYLPGVTTGPFAYPFPDNGAEAPPRDASGCGPSAPPSSSNGPSAASPFVSTGSRVPHTSDPAVQPLPRRSQPPATTAPTEPPVAEVRGTPASPAMKSAVTMDTGQRSPTTAAACQTVNPLPGGVLSPLRTSDCASLGTESSVYTTPTDGESEAELHPAMPTPTSTGGPCAPASAEPVSHWGHGIGSPQMSPPLYSASRSGTPAAPSYAAEDTTTLHQLDAQPLTTDTGLPSVSATPECTGMLVGAIRTEAGGATPQSVTASPPASESPSGKANGDISMEAADWSEDDELSEGAGALCSDSHVSQEEPTVSPGRREDGEAGGEASSPRLLPCERASATGEGDSVEHAVTCTSAHFEIPSANLVDLCTVHKVVVSHYKTPSNFWLQLRSSEAVLETMTNSLRDHCDAISPHSGFETRLGMFCAARYTLDQFWYRAKIMKQESDHVKVSYVDFGNSELVKLEDLRPLDKSHTLLPAQALNCGIIPPVALRGEWPLASLRQFQKMLEDAEQLEAKFLWRDRRSSRYMVELLSRPVGSQAVVNLSEEFLSQPVNPMTHPRAPRTTAPPATAPAVISPSPLALTPPRPAAPPVTSAATGPQTPTGSPRVSNLLAAVAARQLRLKSLPSVAGPSVGPPAKIPPAVLPDQDSIPIVISVIFSPAKFYAIAQTEDGLEKKLEDMQREMGIWALRSNPPAVDDVTEGTFWFCLYDQDRRWYRARVIEDANKDCPWLRARVLLVDYGSVCMVPLWNMRPLPAHLAELPACAHRMSLAFVVPRGMGEDGDGGGDKWDEEVTKLFLQNTGVHTVLIAERRGQRQLGFETVHDVLLWNRSCQPAMNINLLLLEGNRAELKPQVEEEHEAKESP